VESSGPATPIESDNEGCRTDGDRYVLAPHDAALGGPLAEPGVLRAMPFLGQGKQPDGVRIGGMSEGAPPKSCGLYNGDIVHQVNGEPVTTEAALRAAVDRARSDGAWVFVLTRRGEPRKIWVTVDAKVP